MGQRTEQGLLPPESARAIYNTIEAQGSALRTQVEALAVILRKEMSETGRDHGHKLDQIIGAIDGMKEQLADGRVQFERHEGQLKLLNNDIEHTNRRVDEVKSQVDDVESDFNKFYPPAVRKNPTGLHPTMRTPAVGQRVIPDSGTALERKKSSPLFSINPKLTQAFWIATIAALGTAFGGWVVNRLAETRYAQVLEAHAPEVKAPTPPSPSASTPP